MSAVEERILSVARDLIVDEGFAPLDKGLPAAGWASGLFHTCLVRMDAEVLQVHAMLAWRGQEPDELAGRAESLRQALSGASQGLTQRICATLFLVAEAASELPLIDAVLEKVPEGHFLQKILVARASVALSSGAVHFHGRVQPKPNLDWFEQHFVAPTLHDASEAEAVLLRHDQDESQARRLLVKGETWATWVLIALNIGVFAAQIHVANTLQAQLGSGQDADQSQNLALQVMGANQHELVFGMGQWWRLLSCMFLHGGYAHLFLNMLSLFYIGSLLERLVGTWRFLAIYFLAGLGGSLLSALNPENIMSVGASGAIMGLAGALLALNFRPPQGFPRQLAKHIYKALLRPVVLTIATGVLLALFGGPIMMDNWAHLGGLASGFALAWGAPSIMQKPLRNRA